MASASQISFRNLGRQSWASAPTPRGGTRGRHAGVVVPYGWLRRAAAIALGSGADGRNGWESRQRSPQKCPATPDNPSVSLRLTAPFAQGSLSPRGTKDADCRVASLLAMTVLNLCHSEEAQRADVGIRPFCDGRGSRPPYLGHGLRRPNFVPKFGASVRSSAPTESPSQPARSEASAPAAARDGRESTQEPSPKGTAPATTPAALSEAESAERAAGQIRSSPDTLKVQHGVQGPEVSAKPRPCSRRGCVN